MKAKCYRIERTDGQLHYISIYQGICAKAPHEVKWMKGWGMEQIENFCRSAKWKLEYYSESSIYEPSN